MIKNALEYLIDLGNKREVEINGETYTNDNLKRIDKPLPSEIEVTTLTGLTDFIYQNKDALDFSKMYIHVVSPTQVRLMSALEGHRRIVYVEAEPLIPNIPYGSYLDTERFNILLQSSFKENKDREILLRFSGNIEENLNKQTLDDGVTQVVTMKTGVATKENVAVPNPVTLIPYRTFVEIDQVESKFIFRAQEGPRCAIFEADAGAWRNEAMKRIKEYLEKELADFEIGILA